MHFGNLELLLLIGLVVMAVFFSSRCSMKCKCKNSNDNDDSDTFDIIEDDMDDSAYSLPFSGGEIVPGEWSLPFAGGSVIPEGTYADTGIGTF